MEMRRAWHRTALALWMGTSLVLAGTILGAQELGSAGTVQGTVKDPTGGVMVAVTVNLSNAVSGFKRETTTDASGKFVFRNVPPNSYRLEITAQGFQTVERNVDVRTSVPIDLDGAADCRRAEQRRGRRTRDRPRRARPDAHTDIDQSLVDKLPIETSSGINQVITLASPGVVADSNGFFHPVGDHAQTQFSIDNQPVTDQQSRIYSNQISQDAVQSMEVITGVAPAEFGDKDSLVVQIVTKSGLDHLKPTGSVSASYGSFKSPGGDVNVGVGSHTFGNFLSATGLETDRFLDPPEFQAMHDNGNSQSLFDRVDVHPNDVDSYHLNVQSARSSFDIPNTYDAQCVPSCAEPQATGPANQHQNITSFNVAPGYSRIFGGTTELTANGYVRQDHVTYTPSANPFNDTPGSVSQDRRLTNFGGKVDIGYAKGANNIKFGVSASATELSEQFTIGLTDPGENSPCVDSSGNPVPDPTLVSTSQCAATGLTANPDFAPGLEPYDFSRGATTPYAFSGSATIKQQAAYAQDEITASNVTLKLGLRFDNYDGLTSASALEPRVGLSYSVPATKTVVRASYGRTLETPYNENLVLSTTANPAVFGYQRSRAPTRTPRPGGYRHSASTRPLGRRRRRLLLQAHEERVRLRRAVRYADRVPDCLGSFESGWDHGTRQFGRARRLQRLHRLRAHQCLLLPAWDGRDSERSANRRVPDRPRSKVRTDDERAVPSSSNRLAPGSRCRGSTSQASSPAPSPTTPRR